ncbi:multidrug effflux MFS transporter [Vibrio sp. Isolate23]|uniref:multidrug effflux MFS transporter n=1 Tax=Vibrio sp. Isolate23 TaxID=2908533 RepID=UPI001EFC47FF|nr:multidrug effflux MFS transporter [Vibrio sp. Isolate23]MCG9681725.1 multidrug effflux MFS transporter [Vibrio sp. Isolate23]
MSTLNHKMVLPLLMVFMVLNSMPIDIYLPAVKTISEDLSTSVNNVQLGIFLYMISMGLGQLILGAKSDKYGRKPVAIFSLVVYVAASVLASVSTSIEMLMVSRLLQGFGACGCAVTALAVVRDIYDESESARIYSLLNGAQSLVPALAPLLGGFIAVSFGWRYCFILLSVMSITTLLFSWSRMVETNTVSGREEYNRSYASIVTNKKFLTYALASMSSMAFIVQYVVKSPVLLIDNLGLTPTVFSLVFGGNALLIILASYCATKVISRYSPKVTCNLGLTFLLIASVLFLLITNPKNIYIYLVIVSVGSFGFSFCLGSAIGLALSPFPDCAGKASAVLGFMQFTLTSIIGIIVGILFPSGAHSISITVACFAMLSILASLFFRKSTSRATQYS